MLETHAGAGPHDDGVVRLPWVLGGGQTAERKGTATSGEATVATDRFRHHQR